MLKVKFIRTSEEGDAVLKAIGKLQDEIKVFDQDILDYVKYVEAARKLKEEALKQITLLLRVVDADTTN